MRQGFGPQGWDMGLEAERLEVGGRGGYEEGEGGEGGEEGGENPPYV